MSHHRRGGVNKLMSLAPVKESPRAEARRQGSKVAKATTSSKSQPRKKR